MTVYPVIKFGIARFKCMLLGHEMHADRFFHPPSSSVQSGYVCDRCGHTQLLLYRWQEVNE